MSDISEKLNLALKLHQSEQIQQAESLYKEILEIDPCNPDALHLLGVIFTGRQEYEKALNYIKKAINLRKSANYFSSLAKVYTCQSNNLEAINCYMQLINIDPNCVEAYNNMGNLLVCLNKTDEAIACYITAIKINPDYVNSYYNLGNTLLNNNEIDSAKNFYNLAIKLKPDYAEAYYNLGAAFHFENNIRKAINYYEKAVSLKPDCLEVYYNLSSAYLIEKDFEKGWEIFRKIRQMKQKNKKIDESLLKIQWNGESLEGKTIYVFHEQGIGDTIFSARYLPLLNSMGAKVKLKPQAGLEKLFRQSDFDIEVIDNSVPEEYIDFDTHISMYYMLSILNMNTQHIPFPDGYLKVDKQKSEYYRQKYFNNDKFKTGIVWQGNPKFKNDKKRSISLKELYPLADIPEIKLYSLQKGSGSEQLLELPENLEIIDIGNSFNDFSDTAAAIDNLDLLISVDTSVVHLAGALGKPAWVLIPYSPDWRWFLESDESVWYKSIKLFRQKEPGNWLEVIDRVCKSLYK